MSECPEKLYHYCSNEAFCSIVTGGNVWLTSLNLSNDSMEGKWFRSIFEEECREQGIPSHNLPEILAHFDIILKIADGLGFCLSEKRDLLSQWRGYADDGKGVCIGIDGDCLRRGWPPGDSNLPGFTLRKVNYGKVGSNSNLKSVVKGVLESAEAGAWNRKTLLGLPPKGKTWEDLEREKKKASFSMLMLLGELFEIKNPAFVEECEWRLLSIRGKSATERCEFRASGSKILPYRSYPLFQENKSAIREVVLGPKNESSVGDVMQMLAQLGFDEANVRRSEASYR